MGKYTRQPSRLGAALCTPLYHRFWILSVPQNPRLGDKPEKNFQKTRKNTANSRTSVLFLEVLPMKKRMLPLLLLAALLLALTGCGEETLLDKNDPVTRNSWYV